MQIIVKIVNYELHFKFNDYSAYQSRVTNNNFTITNSKYNN